MKFQQPKVIKKKHRVDKFKTALLRIMKRYKIQTLRVFTNKLCGYSINDKRLFTFSRLENTSLPRYSLLNSDWVTIVEEKK